MIEIGILEKQLSDRKRELNRLEAMQKIEPISQDLLDILESFEELDDFLEVSEGPKAELTKQKKEPNPKKSSSRLSFNKEQKPSSDKFDPSSEDPKENNREYIEDLFMIDQTIDWQRTSDIGPKRL